MYAAVQDRRGIRRVEGLRERERERETERERILHLDSWEASKHNITVPHMPAEAILPVSRAADKHTCMPVVNSSASFISRPILSS